MVASDNAEATVLPLQRANEIKCQALFVHLMKVLQRKVARLELVKYMHPIWEMLNELLCNDTSGRTSCLHLFSFLAGRNHFVVECLVFAHRAPLFRIPILASWTCFMRCRMSPLSTR